MPDAQHLAGTQIAAGAWQRFALKFHQGTAFARSLARFPTCPTALHFG
jgi:hypothetical protein